MAIALLEILKVVTPVAGAALDCERTGLAGVVVVDANNAVVPAARYTATEGELAAGIIHWADPLSTAGHPTPWTVAHAPGLALPLGLFWSNRFEWQGGLSQTVTPTTGGAVVIESFQMLAGREIKLTPPEGGVGLMDYATVEALDAWASVAGKRLLLLLDGAYYRVQFQRPALDPKPALGFSKFASNERWACSLFFLTV